MEAIERITSNGRSDPVRVRRIPANVLSTSACDLVTWSVIQAQNRALTTDKGESFRMTHDERDPPRTVQHRAFLARLDTEEAPEWERVLRDSPADWAGLLTVFVDSLARQAGGPSPCPTPPDAPEPAPEGEAVPPAPPAPGTAVRPRPYPVRLPDT